MSILVVLAGSVVWLVAFPALALAKTYEVGPDKKYANIDDVPWEVLNAGDRVLIHWRPEPYRAKWVVCRRGTRERPIIISGVLGPKGQQPVIDGRSAVTRPELQFWNEERGVIKIGGANVPEDTLPAWIVLENLEVRSGRPPFRFVSRRGVLPYARNAAAIYVEKGEHLVIRGCTIRDSGNGLFIGPETSDVLIEGCRIEGNGIEGSGYEHNAYTAALGIVFQFNRFGPLRSGCAGNNLKDRSAGLVIRYNWIEGGNRQLDLVDAEDSERHRDHASYRETFVYGNVLVERDGDGNNQIVHYGGDSGEEEWYRQGTLYFYHNTVVSQRSGTTVAFRLSTNGETVDCRNNIFFVTAPGRHLALMTTSGRAMLGRNWLKTGWRISHERFRGSVVGLESSLTGDRPGFVDPARGDLHLQATSPCVNAGAALPEALQRRHPVLFEFSATDFPVRRVQDAKPDIGAFEFGGDGQ
ncbi:MAG: polysaccharide-degrading enzyme [Planctomycetes bacterium]|nr:polysaccharide-degrading enzyme [Planctomycetota bacterium]